VKKPKDQPSWESWIDQQIREAQERGAFNGLAGQGKPLDLALNPYAQEQELAFKVLRDAGYAPEWIELDKTIRARSDRARALLARRWEWRCERLEELGQRPDTWARAERERVEGGWHRAMAAFGQEVDAINKEIVDLNLKVPSLRFQRPKLDAATEIAGLTERTA
jgi:DnaJ family protein C protein 28